MPSLMTCPPLLYQLSVTPEIRQHLRPFNCNTISISIGSTNNNASKNNKKIKRIDQRKKVKNSLNICNIYELKQHQKQQQHLQQQQNSQRDCLQKIVLKKSQEIKEKHKRRRWILSCNLITILKKQIKLTNPTFDIQQQQQQQQQQPKQQQVQHQSQQQLQQKQHCICKI